MSCSEQLANLEQDRGIRSAFAFVPMRYHTPPEVRQRLLDRGFEVIVHDLNHDGKLYRNRKIFESRCGAINDFLRQWNARGFASGASLHNLQWISELNIEYDISTYDVDPFEPQSCGHGRIFPYWVQSTADQRRGYVELPYTLAQDFTLFVLLREKSNEVWRRKLDWIAAKGGMALIKTHPDYMAFSDDESRADRYPVSLYTDFMDYALNRYGDVAWFAKPGEVARYWCSLAPSLQEPPIPSQETFCGTCRTAHATGWLHHYRTASHQLSKRVAIP